MLAARDIIMANYQVPEDIRQMRRKSKGRKASSPGLSNKRGMVAGREHEAAIAPQPAKTQPSLVT
jgi:hypothetical protein